jgi:CDP-glycerol glycerophosphotransferase (TagB/SpsB family)
MPVPGPGEPGHGRPAHLLARGLQSVLEAADGTYVRARRALRRQLTAAQRSDSLVRRTAYVAVRQTTRRVVNRLTDRQIGWTGTLWRARWLEGATFEISGWAYERGYGYLENPSTRVFLCRPGSRDRVQASVIPVLEMEVNGLARNAEHDYANTAFVAAFDLGPVLADPSTEPWQVHLEVTGRDGRTRRGTLKTRHRHSSAMFLGARTFADGVQLVPSWVRRRGLVVSRTPRSAVAASVHIADRTVSVDLSLHDVVPVRAELVSRGARRPLDLLRTGSNSAWASGQVPPTWLVNHAGDEPFEPESDANVLEPATPVEGEDVIEEPGSEQLEAPRPAAGSPREGQRLAPQTYRVVLTDAAGVEHTVATALDDSGTVGSAGSGLLAYGGRLGDLYVSDSGTTMVSTEVTLAPGPEPRLHLRGSWGGPDHHVTMTFSGRRQEIPVDLTVHADGTWQATVDLYQGQWGGPAQLPRLGSYTLRAATPDGMSVRVLCAAPIVARTPEKLDVPEARLRLEVGRGRALRLRVGLTRAADELGSFHQRRMDQAYLTAAHLPQRSIYFESFYGRLATCNPYAIDRVVAREHPEWIRYWGVTDLSVAVPEGSVPVVEGTHRWFEARARSRYVVANDWVRRRFVRQEFQTVLQTWHGSMFKRIGLDRPAVRASTRAALETERDKWDVLLSQNPHSTEIFRSAYAWDGPVYEEGYPRNDPLSTGSGTQVRARLGIRRDQKAILYAPTWRDDAPGMVVLLDLDLLSAQLGDDHVILLRGHSRTTQHGSTVRHRRVIDVTTYPSVTELFLAADALITDYSSVMFDYSVTGRPMVFYTPDLDAYRDDVRGVYFDLAAQAPGPVVRTQGEVVEALRAMDDPAPYAERYATWVRRYNPWDDGHSAERVVRRLFSEHPADP